MNKLHEAVMKRLRDKIEQEIAEHAEKHADLIRALADAKPARGGKAFNKWFAIVEALEQEHGYLFVVAMQEFIDKRN